MLNILIKCQPHFDVYKPGILMKRHFHTNKVKHFPNTSNTFFTIALTFKMCDQKFILTVAHQVF